MCWYPAPTGLYALLMTHRTCRYCGNQFRPNWHRAGARARIGYRYYCSMACKKGQRNVVVRACDRRRIAKKKGSGGSHTHQDVADLLRIQRYRCAYCHVRITSKTKQIDHIMPLALGGTNNRCNLQMLCRPCNARKRDKHPIEYAQSIGLLL
jgi:5-methylcytosine-specific restriction endonuclease McrA